jgi:hypothetical protein
MRPMRLHGVSEEQLRQLDDLYHPAADRGRPRAADDEHLWCWWLVFERCMRSDRVVVVPSVLDDDLSFPQRIEHLRVQVRCASAH